MNENSQQLENRDAMRAGKREPSRGNRFFQPRVDIVETADALEVYADIPGSSAEEIDVNFENGVLSIHGRVSPRQTDATKFIVQEYELGDFYRSFEVNEKIDSSRIAADFNAGVLKLTLPLSEDTKPRKIAVRGGHA